MLTSDKQCKDMKMYPLPLALIWLESRNHEGERNGRRSIFPGKLEATFITIWE